MRYAYCALLADYQHVITYQQNSKLPGNLARVGCGYFSVPGGTGFASLGRALVKRTCLRGRPMQEDVGVTAGIHVGLGAPEVFLPEPVDVCR